MDLSRARSRDWERALADYIAMCAPRPFVWGEHDCLLFAAGAELAMTGIDPAAEIRGRYRSQAGAMRLLRVRGFTSVEEAVDAHKRAVAVGFARRGDWALHDGSIGVVMGPFALFVGEAEGRCGLVRVPRVEWTKAWAVG